MNFTSREKKNETEKMFRKIELGKFLRGHKRPETRVVSIDKIAHEFLKKIYGFHELESKDKVFIAFDEMLEQNWNKDDEIVSSLMEALAYKIHELFEEMDEGPTYQMKNNLINVLVRISQKYFENLQLFESIFDNFMKRKKVLWSFDAFTETIYMNLNIGLESNFSFACRKMIYNIWWNYFSDFLECASEDSIYAIRLADETLFAGKIEYRLYKAFENDDTCGYHINLNIFNCISRYFPDMKHALLERYMISYMRIFYALDDYNAIDIESDSEDWLRVIRELKDYAQYQSTISYVMYEKWNEIFEFAIDLFDGTVINELIDYLVNCIHIPIEEINSAIEKKVDYLLNDDTDYSSYNIIRIGKLLPNPTVFKLIEQFNYSIIENFGI